MQNVSKCLYSLYAWSLYSTFINGVLILLLFNVTVAAFYFVAVAIYHVTPQLFYGPFFGTTRVSRCQKKTSGLYGARED